MLLSPSSSSCLGARTFPDIRLVIFERSALVAAHCCGFLRFVQPCKGKSGLNTVWSNNPRRDNTPLMHSLPHTTWADD
jgi:hypothetical protein